MDEVIPFSHPVTGQILVWDDVSTWWCFDCLQEADDYCHLDGFVRCFDCTAVWGEHHLDHEEHWRSPFRLDRSTGAS